MIPKRPDLRVIDRAIKRIRFGLSHYTCYALRDAAIEIHECSSAAMEYRQQYRRVIRNLMGGFMPYWWCDLRPCKEDRIKALQAFRQACIDAAKKEAKQ